jgi:MoaA/NifB/PqqE/SkfB family radical SAM enzyme
MCGGVRALHRIQADFPVAARCTVQKQNCAHLAATVQAAREMGLRSISFLAADLTSAAFNRSGGWPPERQAEVALDAGEIAALEREIDALNEDGFILESPEKLRRIAHHFRAHLGLEEPVAPRCNAPWVSAVVESDGTVRPCFFHEPIGSLAQTSLLQVVNGPRAVAFRQSLDVSENPICRRCVCSLYLPG